MREPRKSDHWYENRISGNQMRRTLGDNLCYKPPGSSIYQLCDPGMSVLTGAPPEWEGAVCEFTHGCQVAALHCFVGDNTDPDNSALMGMRISCDCGCWANFKWMGVTQAETQIIGQRTLWANLWPNSNLNYYAGRGRISMELEIYAPGGPASYSNTIKQGAGHTAAMNPTGGLDLKKPGGETMMSLPPPSAEDANGVMIPVTTDMPGPQGGFEVVRLTLDPDAMEDATYPVMIR